MAFGGKCRSINKNMYVSDGGARQLDAETVGNICNYFTFVQQSATSALLAPVKTTAVKM